MMSHFVFILLVEAILVLSIALIVLLVFNWKNKKKKAAEIEQLLGQTEENEATRKKQLVDYLTSQLSMQEQSAVEQAEDFIAAEKRFTQQFLVIQLNQQPVSGFYQYSCEFVDKYLQLIAENMPKVINDDLDITGEDSPEEKQLDTNNSEELEEESKESKESEVNDVETESIDSNLEELDSDEERNTSSAEADTSGEINNAEGEEDEFA